MKRKILSPLSVVRIRKLWPHARKQGREIGQVYRVGYYCKDCGTEDIWLVDENGNYSWTVDLDFIENFFEIIEESNEPSLYGEGKSPIGPKKMGRQRLNSDYDI